MASGNMLFGNNGVGNNAGPDQTTLTSTNPNLTLQVSNTANGTGLLATGSINGVNGRGTGGGAGVFGLNRATGNGVAGRSQQLNGVQGQSESQAASGVYGENLSSGGFGVAGRSNVPPGNPGAAVFGDNTVGGNAGVFNEGVRDASHMGTR